MKEAYQIVAVNPGSTSTKCAVFLDERELYRKTVAHPAEILQALTTWEAERDFRESVLLEALRESGVRMEETAAFTGICTGLPPMRGGVYEVNELMLSHAIRGNGTRHPGRFGPILVGELARRFGVRGFVVDPSSTDELVPEARLTGLHEILRCGKGHPLNQREAARRCAAELGKRYEELNFVIAHMGGGISVTAHRRGRMIDTIDATMGEGRMAPTRAGALPAADLVRLCFSGAFTCEELLNRLHARGGWMDLLGVADAREIEERIQGGDSFAALVMDATAYQLAKDIGSCAAALCGAVDAVILTGGLARSERLTSRVTEMVAFLAPVHVYPSEFELEALNAGALRVLRGEKAARAYTGEPVFRGFDTTGRERQRE